MSEVSVPEPLSGSEIIEAIVYRVRDQLQRDCFLSASTAYETFECSILIQARLRDVGRQEDTQAKVVVNQGPAITAENPPTNEGTSAATYEPAPPNVIRQETEQGVPVHVGDSSGRTEVKKITYKKADKNAAKKGAEPPAA